MSVCEYVLAFTNFSCYAPEMVNDMKSRMILFVASSGLALGTQGSTTMLIGDMDISKLMDYV